MAKGSKRRRRSAPAVKPDARGPVWFRARIRNARVRSAGVVDLPWSALRQGPVDGARPKASARPRGSKFHPEIRRLRALEARRAKTGKSQRRTRTQLILLFEDTLVIPALPGMAETLRTKAQYRAAVRRNRKTIDTIIAARAPECEARRRVRRRQCRARVLNDFWLVNATLVDIAVADIGTLSKLPGLRSVEPRVLEGSKPTATDARDDNDPIHARLVMRTDPYLAALGPHQDRIGLLDTGVRRGHRILSSPSRIGEWVDCRLHPACLGGSPGDIDAVGHGTALAGLITGNDYFGNRHKGLTEHIVDSYRVFDDRVSTDLSAAVSAMQTALLRNDQVIIPVIGVVPNWAWGALTAAADRAYDAGATVITAAGNEGPQPGTTTMPGNAHRALAVGMRELNGNTLVPRQGRGPTVDGRVKPDIQAPTHVEGPGNANDESFVVPGGTSCSTPLAGAAAALARSWMASVAPFRTLPGHVYAYLINSGHLTGISATSGAGTIQLPINGTVWWGHVDLGPGQSADFPLVAAGPVAEGFKVAAWWPELDWPFHNRIILKLIAPNGTVSGPGRHPDSVFQKTINHIGAVHAGERWTLRVEAPSFSGQQVYVAAYLR